MYPIYVDAWGVCHEHDLWIDARAAALHIDEEVFVTEDRPGHSNTQIFNYRCAHPNSTKLQSRAPEEKILNSRNGSPRWKK